MGKIYKMYDKSIAVDIIHRVAMGETLNSIVKEPDMPSRRTFYEWLHKNSDLRTAYRMARELSAYSLEEDALETARSLRDNPPKDRTEVSAKAEFLKQARWSAEKRNAQEFGVNAKQAVTVPITINTSLDLGSAPGSGTKEHPNIYAVRIEQAIDPEKEESDADDTP